MLNRSTFANAAGTTRSKLAGKDEIKWQELLSRQSTLRISLALTAADKPLIQTSEQYRPDMKRPADVMQTATLAQSLARTIRHPRKRKSAQVQASALGPEQAVSVVLEARRSVERLDPDPPRANDSRAWTGASRDSHQ